ncbi:hypothetical protein QWJ90_03900 [Microbacterium oryzae]|uniref:hypothetical protein n=1 Tax=Microbacterium oryzae TaxID=743009 RepID=UPI0025B01E46|nr:hypothetical protein [Microbacterium oryzae]MDN3310068.1 hypothetical protein [Microbacterium oryzae]
MAMLSAWIIIGIETLAPSRVAAVQNWHLRTDPRCNRYQRPKPGSRLERISRGRGCPPCRRRQASSAPH